MKNVFAFLALVSIFGGIVRSDGIAMSKTPLIYIFMSQELAEYRQALDEFQAVLDRSNVRCEFTIVNAPFSENLTRVNGTNSLRANLIVSIGTDATEYTKSRFSDIPHLFMMVLEPPFGEYTAHNEGDERSVGIRLNPPLEVYFPVLKRTFPSLERLSFFYHPLQDSSFLEQIRSAAENAGIQVLPIAISNARQVPDAMKMVRNKSDMFLITPLSSAMNVLTLQYILSFSITHKFPIIGLSEAHVRSGAVLALSQDYHEIGKDAAYLALKLLSDRRVPSEMISSNDYHLLINLNMLKSLNLKIDRTALNKADKIISE